MFIITINMSLFVLCISKKVINHYYYDIAHVNVACMITKLDFELGRHLRVLSLKIITSDDHLVT